MPEARAIEPLGRVSTVDALAAALRSRIFEGELAAGERLPERELTERYAVARHTVRAALRALAVEGLVAIEPNRGARVASLEAAEVESLFELRAALELEAAHLALERNGGRLPQEVRDAVAELGAVCARPTRPGATSPTPTTPSTRRSSAAAGSERIARAYEGLAAEMRLFVTAIRPHWTLERMAAQHEQLIEGLERTGPQALREHLEAGRRSIRRREK